jgi:CRISPR-associated endoribonuclease Cas6
MRFQITFNRTGKQKMLPMDYQYYISAWIYKVLKQADSKFAGFLHNKGYGDSPHKLYKLFCFSRLNFGKPTMWKERKLFEINSNALTLNVSFDVPEAATTFIKGLFMEQDFFLGNRFNGIELNVSNVEALPEPQFTEVMHYRLLAPWVVSFKPENSTIAQYLKPDEKDFLRLSEKHILEKYNNTRQTELTPDMISLKPLPPFKRSGFLIKPDTPQQTRVVGNIFDFELTAPEIVHQMLWNAGVSEKSTLGFGWVEINNETNKK